MDTTNAKEHFVCPGGSVEILSSGEYRDCLLVQQRRYFFGGGSYDWFWLFRPDGNEIGPVGGDHQPQGALLKKLAGTSARSMLYHSGWRMSLFNLPQLCRLLYVTTTVSDPKQYSGS